MGYISCQLASNISDSQYHKKIMIYMECPGFEYKTDYFLGGCHYFMALFSQEISSVVLPRGDMADGVQNSSFLINADAGFLWLFLEGFLMYRYGI